LHRVNPDPMEATPMEHQYEADCAHEACTAHLVREIARVGFKRAEPRLCIEIELAEDIRYAELEAQREDLFFHLNVF
jgi:hypothetical protein